MHSTGKKNFLLSPLSKSKMNILIQLAYSLEVKLNVFLQVLEFELERPMQDPELQVDALIGLIETPSANMKTQNRVAIGHLIDTQKFMGLVRHFFQRTPG